MTQCQGEKQERRMGAQIVLILNGVIKKGLTEGPLRRGSRVMGTVSPKVLALSLMPCHLKISKEVSD